MTHGENKGHGTLSFLHPTSLKFKLLKTKGKQSIYLQVQVSQSSDKRQGREQMATPSTGQRPQNHLSSSLLLTLGFNAKAKWRER
jgi:hypothetical protein